VPTIETRQRQRTHCSNNCEQNNIKKVMMQILKG
jgi:hypothetical protein